ncbi:MAG: hypothetical protein ACI9TY_001588 [Alphaproteobacteria bacterium]|jgi:hypothetical protein
MKKLLTIALALTALIATSAHAINVVDVKSNIQGTTTSVGSSYGERYQQSFGQKIIALNNDQGSAIEQYGRYEFSTIEGNSKNSGTFSGGANYRVVGNTVAGNSWEDKSETGFSKQRVEGAYESYLNGIEETFAINGEVSDQRYYSTEEHGNYFNRTRTNFTETTRTRTHFAQ